MRFIIRQDRQVRFAAEQIELLRRRPALAAVAGAEEQRQDFAAVPLVLLKCREKQLAIGEAGNARLVIVRLSQSGCGLWMEMVSGSAFSSSGGSGAVVSFTARAAAAVVRSSQEVRLRAWSHGGSSLAEQRWSGNYLASLPLE